MIFFTFRGWRIKGEASLASSGISSNFLFCPFTVSLCFSSASSVESVGIQATLSGGTTGVIARTTSSNTSVPRLNPSARTHLRPSSPARVSLRLGTWQAGTDLVLLSGIKWHVMCAGFTELHTSTKLSSSLSRPLVTSLMPMASCFLTAGLLQHGSVGLEGVCTLSAGSGAGFCSSVGFDAFFLDLLLLPHSRNLLTRCF